MVLSSLQHTPLLKQEPKWINEAYSTHVGLKGECFLLLIHNVSSVLVQITLDLFVLVEKNIYVQLEKIIMYTVFYLFTFQS